MAGLPGCANPEGIGVMSVIALRLYSLLMWLGQPLLRRKLARRGKVESGYLYGVEERFGYYTQPAEAQADLVWVHAVSLGETRTAGLLLKALRQQHPGIRILLTHGTATGRSEGAALVQPGDVQVWQPWDSVGAVQRFLAHFKPRVGLLMETEIWPNLMAVATARSVPLVLVNGRLSEKSLLQALRVAPLSMPAYAALSAVYAQTDDDARRFRQAGAQVTGILGNLKFDATPDAAQCARGQAWRESLARPVLMFASSREGEEALLFDAIRNTGSTATSSAAERPVFLVVPRHPQRFDEVASLAQSRGFAVSRRSGWGDGPAQSGEAMAADVWLGDSLGEMALYYSLSEAALLGGSFAPVGGQNLIEAAACGCPVVMGLHTFNFADAAELAESTGAAFRVSDMKAALHGALQLMADAAAQKRAAGAGMAFAAHHRGATARTVSALKPYLDRQDRGG